MKSIYFSLFCNFVLFKESFVCYYTRNLRVICVYTSAWCFFYIFVAFLQGLSLTPNVDSEVRLKQKCCSVQRLGKTSYDYHVAKVVKPSN